MGKFGKYNWNVYTLINKLNSLQKMLLTEQNPRKIELINKDISILQSCIEEYFDNDAYDMPSLLECYDGVKEYLGDIHLFWGDIIEFSELEEPDFKFIPKIKRCSLSQDDILSLTHDFYRSLGSFYFGNFMKHFYRRKDHIVFRKYQEESICSGSSICLSSKPESFIEVFRTYTIDDVLTTIHEYSHAISATINPANFDLAKNNFIETDTLFMELIANDYLKSLTNDKNLLITKAENHLQEISFALDLSDLISLVETEETLKSGYTSNRVMKKAASEECGIHPMELENILQNVAMSSGNVEYIMSYLLSIELYNIYKQDRDKALYLLKKFILLDCDSQEQYYSNIKRLGIIPNLSTREFNHDLNLELKRTFPKPKKVARK